MSGFEVLLLGVILGLLVMVIVRPQALVIPTVVAQPGEGIGGGGCLLPLILGLLLLMLLLFGGKPL